MSPHAPPCPVSRAHLVQSPAQGLRFGRTRLHGDDLMARLAAERLADALTEADLAVVRAAAAPDPRGQRRLDLPEPAEGSYEVAAGSAGVSEAVLAGLDRRLSGDRP